MHARALEIAWHESTAIWSLDISRTNRLLTAGGDKVARVWRLSKTPHETLRRIDESTIKTVIFNSQASLVDWLCDLRAHTTTVNVARFSRDGFTIATGADGGEIVIWTLEDGQPMKSLSDGDAPIPKERWVRLATLRGHVQDVLDVAWSSDGSRLVSASIDNSIKVWDIRNPSKTPATLRSHANFVQGVSIDPFGRLIASLGNDRALRIFTSSASNSWYQVASVSSHMDNNDSRLFIDDAKFKNCFRRLAWSPDGSVVACPSGMNFPHTKRSFTVHIFARNTWYRPAAQCGGLVKPACAVRFSPVLYELRRVKEKCDGVDVAPVETGKGPFASFKYRMIFAVLCVDSVLFYDTQVLSRPFAMVEGLHCAENTDIAWSPDGLTAAISSVDGYASFVCFTKEELGEPLALKNTPQWLNRQEELEQSLMGRNPRNSQAKVAITVVRPKSISDPTIGSHRPSIRSPSRPVVTANNVKEGPTLSPPPIAPGDSAKAVVSQSSGTARPANVTKTANGGQRVSALRANGEECLNSTSRTGGTEKESETAEKAIREAMSEILMTENSQSPIPTSQKTKESRLRISPQVLTSRLEHENAGKVMPAIEATPSKLVTQEASRPVASGTDQVKSNDNEEPRSPITTSQSPGKAVSVDPASPFKPNAAAVPKLPKPVRLTPNLTARLANVAREASDSQKATPETFVPKGRPKSGKIVQTTLFSFTGGNRKSPEKPKRRPVAPESRKVSSDVSIQADRSNIQKRKLITSTNPPQEEDEKHVVEASDSIAKDASFGDAKRRKLTVGAGPNSLS